MATALREDLETLAASWRNTGSLLDEAGRELTSLLAAHPVEPTTAEQVVADFIAQREEYIRVLKQTVNANHDYYRWQGHAEARRQLRDKLAALSAEAVQS